MTILAFAAMTPVSGYLGDRWGRRKLLLRVTTLMALFGLTFGLFLSPERMGTGAQANLGLMTIFMLIGMTLMGLTFGIQSALLPELFPTNVRYTGSAVSYNVASILGAAVAPFIATWLASRYGPSTVGLYLTAMAALTLIALWSIPETRDLDIEVAADAESMRAVSPERDLVDA